MFAAISLLSLLTAQAAPDKSAPTPLRPVVDSRARRAQVLALTGGVRPEQAELEALAAPPQTATWRVYDHYTFADVAVDFSLAYTSTYAFYYVGDDLSLPPDILAEVAAAFDANYITTTANFGPVPDVDGEARLFVLLTDIRDAYSYDPGATTYVPCFFDPLHEHPTEPGSNGREMLFLDLNPTIPDSEEAGRCLTHQLALMVAYNYDPAEEYWVDQGLAYLAEFVAGYGHRPEVERYLQAPDTPLIGWSGSEADIGQVYLWTLYLRQRFGQVGVRQILQSPRHGLAAVEPALGITRAELFHQWLLANYLDDPLGGLYSYAELDIVPSGGDGVSRFSRPPLYETVTMADRETKVITGTLSGYYAARYIAIERSGGSELKISESTPGENYGQSTLINNTVQFFNWVKQIVDLNFAPGDTALLVIGLSRESGSTEYRYNAEEYHVYDYYLPIILK